MKTFACQVEITHKFRVELDETVMNEQWMEEFRQVFYDFHTLEEHAKHIAEFRARFGHRDIEGYGSPLENGKPPWGAHPKRVNHAINIVVVTEEEMDTDVEELT